MIEKGTTVEKTETSSTLAQRRRGTVIDLDPVKGRARVHWTLTAWATPLPISDGHGGTRTWRHRGEKVAWSDWDVRDGFTGVRTWVRLSALTIPQAPFPGAHL